MRETFLIAIASAALATSASAAELRDLCPDRPGNATPPCIVDAGHFQIETGIVDAARDRRGGIASDSASWLATELRIGLTANLEAGIGIAPFNSFTIRDKATGARDHGQGFGDLRFSVRQSLANPDGKHVSLALEPFVTAPTGHSGIGAGRVTAGLLLPFAAELGGGFGFGATPEIDWAANEASGGHHAAYTMVAGVSHPIGGVTAGVELYASRDDDPSGATTTATADATLTWTPSSTPDLQFDAGVNAGLNRDTPALEVYVGIARRF